MEKKYKVHFGYKILVTIMVFGVLGTITYLAFAPVPTTPPPESRYPNLAPFGWYMDLYSTNTTLQLYSSTTNGSRYIETKDGDLAKILWSRCDSIDIGHRIAVIGGEQCNLYMEKYGSLVGYTEIIFEGVLYGFFYEHGGKQYCVVEYIKNNEGTLIYSVHDWRKIAGLPQIVPIPEDFHGVAVDEPVT